MLHIELKTSAVDLCSCSLANQHHIGLKLKISLHWKSIKADKWKALPIKTWSIQHTYPVEAECNFLSKLHIVPLIFCWSNTSLICDMCHCVSPPVVGISPSSGITIWFALSSPNNYDYLTVSFTWSINCSHMQLLHQSMRCCKVFVMNICTICPSYTIERDASLACLLSLLVTFPPL